MIWSTLVAGLKKRISSLCAAFKPERDRIVRPVIVSDVDKVRDFLALAQGKSTARVISEEDLLRVSCEAENFLESIGVPKACRIGLVVDIRTDGYSVGRWVTECSFATIKRFRDGWRLIACRRCLNSDRGGWKLRELHDQAIAGISRSVKARWR